MAGCSNCSRAGYYIKMGLPVQRFLKFPARKEERPSGKSDLSLLWERSLAPSPISSPIPKISGTSRAVSNDIFALLAATKREDTPRKKLFCPQTLIVPPTPKKMPAPVLELLYKSVSIMTNRRFDVPEKISQKITYSFFGGEYQEAAWNNFKTILNYAECSVVSTPTMIFLFCDGVVKGKAITGTALKRLESASDNLPLIPMEAAITKHPCIVSIEDGLQENDYIHWKELNATLVKKVQLVGDDLYTSNPKTIEGKYCNALLLKVNQICTISDVMYAAKLMKLTPDKT
ncbi:enolase family protein [Histomonas meleagridis]|uniref:enolase family protein n=1 Tax=Histomonas meleagridis TaxID=135588 RepID=UPI0035596B94|nr:enolase family protein [Histomonas meleagridis]KAH0800279.1 enolase family protein [Histomonas meleagridis]